MFYKRRYQNVMIKNMLFLTNELAKKAEITTLPSRQGFFTAGFSGLRSNHTSIVSGF